MPNYPVYEHEMANKVAAAGMLSGGGQMVNPTMRENIDQKIQWHKDEIGRLEAVKEKLPQLLDVNLRDLREDTCSSPRDRQGG